MSARKKARVVWLKLRAAEARHVRAGLILAAVHGQGVIAGRRVLSSDIVQLRRRDKAMGRAIRELTRLLND